MAQKQQPPSQDAIAAITTRGKLLYEYDQAAWHSTDAVKAVGVPKGLIDRYVARKTATGWVVAWGRFTQSQDRFLIAYEAVQSAKPDVFTVSKHDPPLEDSGFYFHAARALVTARQDFHGEDRPYNAAVLPGDSGTFYVYILPAQTVGDVYPVGGDSRYIVSADGLTILGKRRMHRDIIEFKFPAPSTRSFHTHVLSDSPEDSDIFDVLTRRPSIPEYVFTCDFTYLINPEASIQIVEPKTCGKECEQFVDTLPSFQSFRKAGCPDMTSSP